MHELAFAQAILEGVQEAAGSYPGAKIVRVSVRAPAVLAIDPASLQFCLEGIAQGTVLEGGRLEVRAGESEYRCRACRGVFAESRYTGQCPDCGATGDVAPSLALIIEEVELHDPEDRS